MRKRFVFILIVLLFSLVGCRRADSDVFLLSDDGKSLSEPVLSDSSLEASKEETIKATESLVCEEAHEEVKRLLAVFVCGAVTNPGVYYLEDGSRLMEAVDAAGGFTEDADVTYVNLAAEVVDGMKLKIPTITDSFGENTSEVIESFDLEVDSSNNSQSLGARLVNINTASKDELKTLPGIGDGIADRIIKYRTDNGKFSSIEDIMKISGIKDKLYGKIKDLITV